MVHSILCRTSIFNSLTRGHLVACPFHKFHRLSHATPCRVHRHWHAGLRILRHNDTNFLPAWVGQRVQEVRSRGGIIICNKQTNCQVKTWATNEILREERFVSQLSRNDEANYLSWTDLIPKWLVGGAKVYREKFFHRIAISLCTVTWLAWARFRCFRVSS